VIPAAPLDPAHDFALERQIAAPPRLVWQAMVEPAHLAVWYMPRAWGRVVHAEVDLRPGGTFRIDIAVGAGPVVENCGCVLAAVPEQQLVWTSMLFADWRPAIFDDIPITAVITLAPNAGGTRLVFTALHRTPAELEINRTSGFEQGTGVALDQLVELVETMASLPPGGVAP
jgi:uncharacterized protein YndB with AHSA1/START domain